MPGKKYLVEPCNKVYLYDGSLEGFYCCVFTSVYKHELPIAIIYDDESQQLLLPHIYIETEPEKAKRVRASIPNKISPRALSIVETVFLSCMENREIALLRFLLLGYENGPKTPNMLAHPDVEKVLKAEKHLLGERHLLLGFIRFSDYNGVLVSTISPKNFVLPFLAGHFCTRFSEENFMIYDRTHHAALIYHNKRRQIVSMLDIELPKATETEQSYRELWKQFYNTIAIETRTNPVCRRTHMPKRYWENMLEVSDLL